MVTGKRTLNKIVQRPRLEHQVKELGPENQQLRHNQNPRTEIYEIWQYDQL